jgi:hypothetical protein
MTGRTWLSFPLGHGVRLGRSWSDADLHPRPKRLQSWQRLEIRDRLAARARARGEPVPSKERLNAAIDRGIAVSQDQALATARDAIDRIEMRRSGWHWAAGIAAVIAALVIIGLMNGAQ